MKHHRMLPLLILALSIQISGCGIDQGGITNTDPPITNKTLVLQGPKMGAVGSLSVNGVEIIVGSADITVDGVAAAEADLRDGQILNVVATESDVVTAVSITYDENIRGPIDSLDTLNNQLMVLGQQVTTNLATVFDIAPAQTLADLTLDTRVEVSGYPTPAGEIVATYIGLAEQGAPLELSNTVTSLDQVMSLFNFGLLVVDFSQAMLFEIPTGVPQIGEFLEIEGEFNAVGEFVATSVRLISSLPGVFTQESLTDAVTAAATEQQGINVNGFITEAGTPNTFTLGQVEVTVSDSTVIVGGTQGDLQTGTLVRVIGDVNSSDGIDAVQVTIL